MTATIPPEARVLVAFAAVETELAARWAVRLGAASGGETRSLWGFGRESIRRASRHDAALMSLANRLRSLSDAEITAARPSIEAWSAERLRVCRRALLEAASALSASREVDLDALFQEDEDVPKRGTPEVVEMPPGLPPTRAPRLREKLDDDSTEQRLARIARRWFDAEARIHEGPGGEDPAASQLCWYELAPRADGTYGLFVVARPVQSFHRAVRTLTLRCGDHERVLLRENLERLGARVEVPIEAADVRWTTGNPAFDEEYAEELSRLSPGSLPEDRPTVFRLDVEGPVQQITGATLSPGASYGVLIPPRFAAHEGDDSGNGWRVLVLDLAPGALDASRTTAERLGLRIAPVPLDLAWIGRSPARWERSPSGALYAVFDLGDAPVAVVRAEQDCAGAVAFLLGPSGLQKMLLPSGRRHVLALDALTAGGYVLEVTSADRDVEPARLVFRVEDHAEGRWRVAMPSLTLGAITLTLDAHDTLDLAMLSDDSVGFRIAAPSGAPLECIWESGAVWRSETLYAGHEGEFDTAALRRRIGSSARTAPLGRWTLRFGDLGDITVTHVRRLDARWRDEVRESLRQAHSLDAADTRRANPVLFRRVWTEPVIASLGWFLRDKPTEDSSVEVLHRVSRRDDRIAIEPAALFVLLDAPLSREGWGDSSLRAELASRCAKHGVTVVLATDTTRWWRIEPRRALLSKSLSLSDALADDALMDDFLYDFSAWE